MKTRLMFIAGAIAVASASFAQGWADNFETYPVGQNLHNVGGWLGWDGDPNATGFVVGSPALGSRSVSITGTSDLVHEYTPTTGTWRYRTSLFVPTAAGTASNSYFILMNNYGVGQSTTWSWSIQVNLNLATNIAIDDFRGPTNPNNWPDVPFSRDVWNTVRVDIDLDTNSCDHWFNGNPLNTVGQRLWHPVAAPGQAKIASVDLYANSVGPVYYDNLSLNHVLAVDSYTITSGENFGGTLASLAASDDDKVFVLNDETTPNTGISFISNETLITSLSYLQINAEFASDRSDISVSMRAKNQNTNAFVTVGAPVTSTLADQSVSVSTTNASAFRSIAGVIETALSGLPLEDLVAADGWQVTVDMWEVETR